MTAIEILVCVLGILGVINLIALRIVARREKKRWDLRMAEIEKQHSERVCEFKAKWARSRMRTRYIKRLLIAQLYGPDALQEEPQGSRDDDSGK